MLRISEIHDVVWPRAARQMEIAPVAPRLDTLEGKTVGFVWDYLFRGDEIFTLLEEGLKQRYPKIKFVNYDGFRLDPWRRRARRLSRDLRTR